MSKKLALFFVFILILFFFLTSSKVSFANHHGEVLGIATEASALLEIPPTVEGPGFILPDSPFFFLDKLKQNLRLFFAITPEDKAKINEAIAGERLAELRFMLAKNNLKAAKTALEGVSDNLNKASGEINRAKLSGRNVTDLAKKINDNIKDKQKVMDILEGQAKGDLKLRVAEIKASLLKAKVRTEEALSEEDLENEINDDLARSVSEKVSAAADFAREIRNQLSALQKEASSAAQTSLSRRQNALQKALEAKNEALRKVEEKLLEKEKEKQAKLLEVQSKVAEQAREAVSKAQEAAKGFETARKAISEIKNTAVSITSSPTPTPTSTPKPAAASDKGKR